MVGEAMLTMQGEKARKDRRRGLPGLVPDGLADEIKDDIRREIPLTVARRRGETTADLVVATLGELGFQIRSVFNSFGEVTVEICTCPLAEVAVGSPEAVRGIQQGMMQEVVDLNAEVIGGRYAVSVRPDARTGSCEGEPRAETGRRLVAGRSELQIWHGSIFTAVTRIGRLRQSGSFDARESLLACRGVIYRSLLPEKVRIAIDGPAAREMRHVQQALGSPW